MEGGDNILHAIYDEDNLDDLDDDVEMIDVEEGELVENGSKSVPGESCTGDIDIENQESLGKNRKRHAKKKKNKRKRKGSGSNGVDINKFVLDACRRLKERKSYMLYTAVGCLGVTALSDIINEIYPPEAISVDAIQACGGQKTADGKRFRTGGGILWSILKVREPEAYKEIMKKAREFEKQFRQPNIRQKSEQKKMDSLQEMPITFSGGNKDSVSDAALPTSQAQNQHEQSASKGTHTSVHDRLRIPVSYDDELLVEGVKNEET